MNTADHAPNLGKLVVNLQSLEFALRAFLLKLNEDQEPKVEIDGLAEGDQVPLNSFTNYDTLGQLIDKFNEIVRPRYSACCVDRKVVDVRDMIAHGRVAGKSPVAPFELVKFGKPSGGMVPVEAVVTMDLAWLSSNVGFVKDQLMKVVDASNSLGQNIMGKLGSDRRA